MKRKSKLIELTPNGIKELTKQAAENGTVFKPYAESILEKVATTPLLAKAFKQRTNINDNTLP